MKSSNRHVAGPVQYTWKGMISPGHIPMDVVVCNFTSGAVEILVY